MNIRPRQIPSFQQGDKLPSTVTWTDPNSTWFTRSGNYGILEGTYNMLKPLYDKWKSSGNQEDYQAYKKAVDAINNDQYRYYQPGYMTYVGSNNQLFTNPQVKTWQQTVNNKYSYINNSIGNRFGQYHIHSKMPNSGDDPTNHWKEDGYWAGITQDRTPWGVLSNPNDPHYLEWKKKFSDIGIDYRTNPEWGDNNVLYGFLQEPKSTLTIPPLGDMKTPWKDRFNNLLKPGTTPIKNQIIPQHKEKYGFDWSKLGQGLQKTFNNPNIIALGRLAGNLINNERVFDEQIQGISPDLKSSYHTHRQIVGDEATKQQFYRRAVQGEQRAAKPFTSDADKQIAYQMEAKRIGDELRAQGDLADNQEIRRTSDESNQHQWANIQRDTEVANVNRASINQANALKHNLLAQKHSAQWSSFDNFLQGIEYRKRQQLAQQETLDDQIFQLQQQQALLDDPRLTNAQKEFQAVLDRHKLSDGRYDTDNEEVLAAKRKYQSLQNQIAIEQYQKRKEYYQNRGTLFGKSGTKLTYKKKDDLLYKSAKDVVEHFRKMSKISSDAQNRKKPKIEKLASHPKGGTKKYQQGGVAPFTVYKPVALGGETTTATETSSTNTTSKSSKEGYEQDLLKELFKSLQTEGLPSDVNGIFQAMNALMQRSQLFGTELSASDIQNMYLQQIQKLNTIKFNKAQYDKVQEIVNSKDAGSEFAVDQYGRIAVQDQEGKISYIKWSELKENFDKYNPLHNSDLLSLRAYSPDQAFNANILQVASNATSMNEIAKFLKEQLPKIGASEQTIEGYTKQDSNLIKAGLQILKDAPAGDYKFSEYSKDQQKQAQMALNYLKGILPNNMKTLLRINSEMQGTSSDVLIASLIGSTLDESYKLELDAVTGKAAKDSNGNSKVGGDDGLKLDAATALISGKGYQSTIEFNPGTSYAVTVNARHSGFQKKSGENMGSGITMQEATTSTLDKVLDWNKATLGGSRINSTGYNRILLNNDDVVGVDLPVGSDKNTPDFSMLQKLQTLDQELLKKGIDDTPQNFKQINQICQEIGLPPKYKNDGSLNDYSWNRFAAFQVIADDSVLLNKDAILDDTLDIVEDDNVREQYEAIIQKNLNTKDYTYKLGSGFLGIGKQALYQGTVFVPINNNYVASALSGGQNISMSQATDLELQQRGYDQSKIKSYRPAINFNEL